MSDNPALVHLRAIMKIDEEYSRKDEDFPCNCEDCCFWCGGDNYHGTGGKIAHKADCSYVAAREYLESLRAPLSAGSN